MYAEKTTVPVAKTRAEIEALLQKYKAAQYMTAVDHESHRARVQFKMRDRFVRFDVRLPELPKYQSSGNMRKHEQAERQRWRALLLVLKAKLESIESQIATFEQEFLAHIVMPGGQTVADLTLPAIAQAYATGRVTLLLTEGQSGAIDAEAVTEGTHS